MFIISNCGESDIVLCLFNLKFFVQLYTWFTYLMWTVFSVMYSVFCDIVLLCVTVFLLCIVLFIFLVLYCVCL
jgi:hypothetical protein